VKQDGLSLEYVDESFRCDKEMRKYSNVIQRLIEHYIDGKE